MGVADESSDYDVILGVEERGRIMSFELQKLKSKYQQEMHLVSRKRPNTVDHSKSLAIVFEEFDPYTSNDSEYKTAVNEFNKMVNTDMAVIILPVFAKLEFCCGVEVDIYTNHNFCFVTVHYKERHAYPKYVL